MVKVVFTPSFLRNYKKLPDKLQAEVRDKIALFENNPALPQLRAHKLKGNLKGYWSFWVNYRYRIIYEYDTKDEIALLEVGDHSIYE